MKAHSTTYLINQAHMSESKRMHLNHCSHGNKKIAQNTLTKTQFTFKYYH